jgi:hypothetical protein
MHSHLEDLDHGSRPTRPDLRALTLVGLLQRILADQHRSYRQEYVEEVLRRVGSDASQEERFAVLLLSDPAVKAIAERFPLKTRPEPRPEPRLEPKRREPLGDNALNPRVLLFGEDGAKFRPLPRQPDAELPAWAIARAIRATPWPGQSLSSYNAKDILRFLDDVYDLHYTNDLSFTSGGQLRLMMSAVGAFNAWAARRLSRDDVGDVA